MTFRYISGLSIGASTGRIPTITGTTGTINCREPRYFDVNCLSGSYTPGLFLTDFLIHDSVLPYEVRGKIDNRAVCIGRGANFVVGNIYRATDIFGRTGNEDWLCVMPFIGVSGTYHLDNWTKGQTHLRSQVWQLDQIDYLLLRIYTEAD